MDQVILVCGKWIFEKTKWLFVVDNSKGCRVLEGNSQTSYDDFIPMVYEDYGLDNRVVEVVLSYKISNSKKLPADTPPVIIGNNRQFQSFLGQTKNATVRLCVEVKEKVLVESIDEGIGGFGNCNLPNTQPRNVYGMVEENIHVTNTHVEEEQVTNAAEDGDDDESRFDYCDDSDGTDSDDENFSLYGIPPEEEEEKPKLPLKKRSLGVYIEEEKEEATYATLEVSSLELAVGQCFETKEDLETRLKILTVLQKFDFDVAKSTPTILIVKCWVKGCQWRVRATPVDEYPKFQVRVFVSEHTCSVTDRSSRSRQATHDILGMLYKDYVGGIGPKVLPMHVAEALNKRWQIKMDYWKAYRTLRSARELVRGSPESGYEQLPVYLYMLRRENPGTFTSRS